MEAYYAEDVVVFENRTLARAGRASCLQYERQQLTQQRTPPRFKLCKLAVDEGAGHAFLEYVVRFTDAEGRAWRLEQVAVQTWHEGKITEDRFYYEGVVDEGNADLDDGHSGVASGRPDSTQMTAVLVYRIWN